MHQEKLKKWAFFYFSPGFSAAHNTMIHRNKDESCELITVGFDPREKQNDRIIETAKKMHKEGVQFIELCGGFGPSWVTKLNQALDFAIPVGSVTYGPEFRKQLYDLMG